MAPRAPVEAFFGVVVGSAQLAIGGGLLGWALATNLDRAAGSGMAQWLLRQSPFELPGKPELLAEMATQPSVYWVVAVVGAGLVAFGVGSFWQARGNLRPANESKNGKVRLELDVLARLGRSLEGKFVLLKGAQAGDAYDVRLECSRRVRKYRSTEDSDNESYMDTEVRYDQRDRSQAVPTAAGLAVPFHFEIPLDMPAHRSGHFMRAGQYQWKIQVAPPKAWFPAVFPLDVRPVAVGEAGPLGEPISEEDARDWTQIELTRGEARSIATAEKMLERWGLRLVLGFGLIGIVLAVIQGISKATR